MRHSSFSKPVVFNKCLGEEHLPGLNFRKCPVLWTQDLPLRSNDSQPAAPIIGGKQLFSVSITSNGKAVACREGYCETQCSLAYTLTSSQPWFLSFPPHSPLTCHPALMCWCWVQARDKMGLLPLRAFSFPLSSVHTLLQSPFLLPALEQNPY